MCGCCLGGGGGGSGFGGLGLGFCGIGWKTLIFVSRAAVMLFALPKMSLCATQVIQPMLTKTDARKA